MRFKELLIFSLVLISLFALISLRKVKVQYDTERDIIIYNDDIFMQSSNKLDEEKPSNPDHEELTLGEYIIYGSISLGKIY